MTKEDLNRFMAGFSGDIRILTKPNGAPNMMLRPVKVKYEIKRGALRIRDGSLLEDGEGYLLIQAVDLRKLARRAARIARGNRKKSRRG